MDMLVLLGLGHFLQLSDVEMNPVSALPEIMGLGGVGGEAHHYEQLFTPSQCTGKNQEEQEDQSCTQLSPGALPVGMILKSKSVSLL